MLRWVVIIFLLFFFSSAGDFHAGDLNILKYFRSDFLERDILGHNDWRVSQKISELVVTQNEAQESLQEDRSVAEEYCGFTRSRELSLALPRHEQRVRDLPRSSHGERSTVNASFSHPFRSVCLVSFTRYYAII